ncbi:MAG TPA: alpha-L-arabinofuranosidase C-terminal domain-containing protein [Anaerolineales bacterium]|nr:alpha-L-arabinofuranosidase C-terminal domain-containing protein [Anaerolineales bacterium]
MEPTKIFLDREFQIAPVDARIFGGFLEHIGRAVYEGVFDPQSKHTNQYGFREDVLGSLQPLSFTAMRYPGGNFASGYHWLDGIGPRDSRPSVRDLASQSIEPNQFGTDEFMQLARLMNWTPMITVNLGTGTPEEARNWVEYCNSPIGTKYADLRAENGASQPHQVKLWCLGNEMDGHWQQGHMPADQYAIQAQQAAKLMKDVDPAIELVVCGSAEIGLPTYMEWDRTVLEYVGDYADFVSLHRYIGKWQSDTADYLAATNSIDQQIEVMDALCRYVQARTHSKKRHYLAFDEWNVWYRTQNAESVNGHGKFAQHLVEEEYNLEDALMVAGFLNSFIRHADVVKIANLAQIVNVIAPILTRGEQILLQSIYYPLLIYSQRREGIALQSKVKGPGYESPSYGFVQTLDTSAILGNGVLHTFLVNRGTEVATAEIVTAGIELKSILSADLITGPSAEARNTFEEPNVICNQKFSNIELADQVAVVQLPPLSIAGISFGTDERA